MPPVDQTVLIVDDEAGIRKVLSITLSDLGYKVYTARESKEALELFRAVRPPIVILDIKMPGMDGLDLLRELKREKPDTQVIMITGHSDLELSEKSLMLEATDFVTKPISQDALEEALHRAIESAVSANASN